MKNAPICKNGGLEFAEYKCCRCRLVKTIPRCHDDNFRPDTLFNSGVVHLKRVPKHSRFPLAENLIPKTNDICETPSNIAFWCLLLPSLSRILEKPPRGGKCQRSTLNAIINKRNWDGVIEKKPKRDKKPRQKNQLDQRLRSICMKLDEGIVKPELEWQ